MPWAATSVAAPPTFVSAPPSTRRPNSWRPDPMRANLIHSTAPASLAVRALPASRRQFLKASAAAGAGLVIGFAFAGGNRIAAARSEEHTSELQSLMRISYSVFFSKKKNNKHRHNTKNEHHCSS